MLSNQLIIRLEKDKTKSKKKQKEWDPPCDCVVIQRPTSKSGPKILNAYCDDRIVFRVQSMSHLHKREDPVYRAQTIGYKVRFILKNKHKFYLKKKTTFLTTYVYCFSTARSKNKSSKVEFSQIEPCKDGEDHRQYKTVTVYPQFTSGTQEVYSDCITEGDQSVFLLRIKKKAEGSERRDRNVELELRTPKPPPRLPSPPSSPPPPPPSFESVPVVAPPVADLVNHKTKKNQKKTIKKAKMKKKKKK